VAAPVVALAVPAAGLAVFGLPAVAEAVARLLAADPPRPHWWEAVLSAALAVAGVAAAGVWVRGTAVVPAVTRQAVGPPLSTGGSWSPAAPGGAVLAGWLRGWLGLEAAAHRLVVRPALVLARALARLDDRVLDGAVCAVAGAAVAAARLADRRLEGAVEGAVGAVARTARGLGALARRPQTGMVHQYFAQAVTVLAALVVVLLLVR
jgi:hypothetical protein